jgi:hypothetical protein
MKPVVMNTSRGILICGPHGRLCPSLAQAYTVSMRRVSEAERAPGVTGTPDYWALDARKYVQRHRPQAPQQKLDAGPQ